MTAVLAAFIDADELFAAGAMTYFPVAALRPRTFAPDFELLFDEPEDLLAIAPRWSDTRRLARPATNDTGACALLKFLG